MRPKIVFLYGGPHPAHKAWARSIGSLFIKDRTDSKGAPSIARILKSLEVYRSIPKDTDFILCESSTQMITALLWKLFHREVRLAAIVSDPKIYHIPRQSLLMRCFYKYLFDQFDLFIPTSPLMKSLLWPELQKRAKVVFPFAILDVVKQVKLNTKNIVFYGRISMDKGTDLLLDMFAKLAKGAPDSRLFISGFSLDDLEERLKHRRIKNISFLGRLPDEALKKILEKCPIYVNLARIDPASVAVLEVMQGGIVPIVSARVGNNYIVREVNEDLVVRSPDEARSLVKRLWEHPELLRRYSARAIKVSQKYNKQASVKLFKTIIDNFIREWQSQ